jgi:membrane fusion protein (multidrug efflux system)
VKVARRLAACAAATALIGCSAHKAPDAAAPATPVAVVEAREGSVAPVQALAGYIAPRQNVAISSDLTEPAAQVNVIEGDRIKRGAVLAVFDVSDLQANLVAADRSAAEADANAVKARYAGVQTIGQGVGLAAQARAALAQAQEKLRLDELTLSRNEALLTNGYIAQQTVDEARETVRSDRAGVASAQAALTSAVSTVTTNGSEVGGLQGASIVAARAAAASARASSDQIRAQIARATLRSPVDGIIVNRNLNPGEYPGSRTLFTVQQSGAVYAILNASSNQVAGLGVGQPARVVPNATRGTEMPGRIAAILGQASPGSTNFTVKVLVPATAGPLLTGTPVTATIALAAVRGTRIPRAAFTDGTETAVVAVRDGTAKTVAVTRIAEDASNAVVARLADGETIVADGGAGIADGQKVAVR